VELVSHVSLNILPDLSGRLRDDGARTGTFRYHDLHLHATLNPSIVSYPLDIDFFAFKGQLKIRRDSKKRRAVHRCFGVATLDTYDFA
jgi:hypothetical protein